MPSARRIQRRGTRGLTIVEGASAIMIFVPLAVLIAMVVVELQHSYTMQRDLQLAAELAARALATEGGAQGAVIANQQAVFQNIVVGNSVVDASQFSPAPVINQSVSPPMVTVYVQSKSTGTKKPFSPTSLDPLNLGKIMVLRAQSSFRLQH